LNQPGLATLRPPLMALTQAKTDELRSSLKGAGHSYAPATI
jgi:hypothetical protein